MGNRPGGWGQDHDPAADALRLLLLLPPSSEHGEQVPDPLYYGRCLGFDEAPHLWGGRAEMEYLDLGMLPGTKVYRLPDDMPLRLGTLAEPLTSCMRAFKRAQGAGGFGAGDAVVIQGSGPVGVPAVTAATRAPAQRASRRCAMTAPASRRASLPTPGR